jgi:pseudouridine-5'-phosphate glycosidase
MSLNHILHLSPEVKDALASKRPVVALESTVISHGLPYPENVTITHEIIRTIRNQGTVPALIALFDGRIHVGLTDAEVERLGTEKNIAKINRADLGPCLYQKRTGATTVSGTMICAHLAHIRVFSTGGIGGVHRYAGETFDVSADLIELAETPVMVVCSGAKSILDVPKTLEYLETHRVPVLGYQTKVFPLFFARQSDHLLNYSFERVEDIAQTAHIHWTLGSKGILVATPPPSADAIACDVAHQYVEEALTVCKNSNITGKDVTPFLLDYMARQSNGLTVHTNKSLLLNNAYVAAQIAHSFSDTVG